MPKPERDLGAVLECGFGGPPSGPGPEYPGRTKPCRAPICERPCPGTLPATLRPHLNRLQPPFHGSVSCAKSRFGPFRAPVLRSFSAHDPNGESCGQGGRKEWRATRGGIRPDPDAETHGQARRLGAPAADRAPTRSPSCRASSQGGTSRTRPEAGFPAPRRPEAPHGPSRKYVAHPCIVRETSSPLSGPSLCCLPLPLPCHCSLM
jgi:hypothetical protein